VPRHIGVWRLFACADTAEDLIDVVDTHINEELIMRIAGSLIVNERLFTTFDHVPCDSLGKCFHCAHVRQNAILLSKFPMLR